ncbi:hypothetical protein V5O48_007227 [Marasmius crinis-equi]|uniref:Uncharacterized protein n=1 Tax=Marasmius crinis-equi TaxID=585013 RepID=A0ABR3FHA5_9AGAR
MVQQLYYYEPNVIAAGIFAGIFLLSGIIHFVQMCRTKTWYCSLLAIGVTMEVIGYSSRIPSSRDPKAVVPYMIQSVDVLVAPVLYAAAIYIIFCRLITKIEGQKHSIIRISRLTLIFVLGSTCTFTLQAFGASFEAGALSHGAHAGQHIIVAGLAFQFFFLGLFIVAAVIFHTRMRMRSSPTTAAQTSEQDEAPVSWRKMFWVLYVASLLITSRSVFRLIEYVQELQGGLHGGVLRKEVWLYAFDASPMALTTLLFNWYHPSRTVFKTGGEKPDILATESV